MNSLKFALLIVALAATIPASRAQEPIKYTYVTQRINPVMAPKGVAEIVRDCWKDENCKKAIEAVAAYIGVPPDAVSKAEPYVSARVSGEETQGEINLPPGYEYCKAKVTLTSIVPYSGKRASVLGVWGRGNGVRYYTWTPKQGVGGSKSWVDADLVLTGVRGDMAVEERRAGRCLPFPAAEWEVMICKGGACRDYSAAQEIGKKCWTHDNRYLESSQWSYTNNPVVCLDRQTGLYGRIVE